MAVGVICFGGISLTMLLTVGPTQNRTSLDVDVLLDDSQEDSQVDGQRRSLADICGLSTTMSKLRRTPMDAGGHQTRGLQNRLRGAAEASWVGSIPIHPRQFSPVLPEMTAKLTATRLDEILLS